MNPQDLLLGAFIYLAAAVIAAPVATRLGLGSVLGYLVAGMVIGPSLLGLVGQEGAHVMHFAEFGVVVMLFLVGLELQPSKLWERRAGHWLRLEGRTCHRPDPCDVVDGNRAAKPQ